MAAPLSLVGPTGDVTVGSTATFTVVDQNALDGFSIGSDIYLADFSLSYDPSLLQYLGTQPSSPNYFVFAPDLSLGDADPAGNFIAQVIFDGTPASPQLPLFTISFRSLAATPGAGTDVTISFPSSGAYGDVDTTVTTPFTPFTTNTTIGAVPEPQTWAMALAGSLLVALITRRRKAR